jgi:hypothetical protein
MTDNNPSWLHDHLAGRAILDGLDHRAHELEMAWGIGRLRLLVPEDLRLRFDRQGERLNHAVRDGSLDELRHEAKRMLAGWNALDAAALAEGHKHLSPDVWEVISPDGEVIAITRTTPEAALHSRQNRAMAVYSLEEVGRLLGHYSATVGLLKTTWPGAMVTAADRSTLSAKLGKADDIPF